MCPVLNMICCIFFFHAQAMTHIRLILTKGRQQNDEVKHKRPKK